MRIWRSLNAAFQSWNKTFDYLPVVYKCAYVRTEMLFKGFINKFQGFWTKFPAILVLQLIAINWWCCNQLFN